MAGRPLVTRIVSGGQTGVDRAALDTALALGLGCGGWAPKGRRAEDGRIPDRYPLRETESAAYDVRTRRNVRDSDATLILTRGRLTGGTALTLQLARSIGRPHLVVDLDAAPHVDAARRWLIDTGVATLNVAGPRESGLPGIYEEARDFLGRLLAPT